jgi:methionyl-tRNA formyltransferase
VPKPRIAFAARRKLGLDVLRVLIEEDVAPAVLLLPAGKSADEHCVEMQRMLPGVPVLRGKAFREDSGIAALKACQIDYLLSIHFPYLIPQQVLDVPKIGALNLHPSFLPFGRGWHTPSWAIEEETPFGATLHWIDAGLDTGDIALQAQVDVCPDDTAHTLCQRAMAAEFELFKAALPLLIAGRLPRTKQGRGAAGHVKADLAALQRLDINAVQPVGATLRRLRALTTNRSDEAAFFVKDGAKYRVRVEITKEDDPTG